MQIVQNVSKLAKTYKKRNSDIRRNMSIICIQEEILQNMSVPFFHFVSYGDH